MLGSVSVSRVELLPFRFFCILLVHLWLVSPVLLVDFFDVLVKQCIIGMGGRMM